MIFPSIYIDVPVIQKVEDNEDSRTEEYSINILNVNYMRKWVGIKGAIQTVLYFQGSDKKYLVVDLPKDTVKARISKALLDMRGIEPTTSSNGSDSE